MIIIYEKERGTIGRALLVLEAMLNFWNVCYFGVMPCVKERYLHRYIATVEKPVCISFSVHSSCLQVIVVD